MSGYMQYLEFTEEKFTFINRLVSNFAMSSSPNKKILEKLINLKNIMEDNSPKKEFLDVMILTLDYFYGNFNDVYKKIEDKYSIESFFDNYNSYSEFELNYIEELLIIYGMEGKQLQEVTFDIKKGQFNLSLFSIGEYEFLKKYFGKYKFFNSEFFQFQFELNTKNIDVKILRKYINSLYKTQFIEKVQSTYTLLRADKNEVSLKDIKKLILTNPFTDGLKTLMLAIKDEKNCSKQMFEEAIKKLYHIRYYHVEAILLYCNYLKNIKDEDYQKWFVQGKKLAQKHYYRYLLHQFNCLDSGIYSDYNEDDYPLPEKLDYSVLIKKFDL